MSLAQKAYNQNNKFTVALDGPSASGKGMIGSLLAKEFSLIYVQSSIVYRGLAYICLQHGINTDKQEEIVNLSATEDIIARVKDVDLNTEEIGAFASKISTSKIIRQNLGKYLTQLIHNTPRIIMEGRDIGTVIAPDADLKIFITADVNIRAERRYKQLQEQGKECILSDILEMLKARDERDKKRDVAPLKPAWGALIIDTSDLTPSQVIQKVKDFVGKI